MNKEDAELLKEIKTKIKKNRCYITLIFGAGALLKRDMETGEIEYIDSYHDDYGELFMQYNTAIWPDLLCGDSWEPIEDSEDEDDKIGIINWPEKQYILIAMHPGLSAKRAWRKEAKEYNDYMSKHADTHIEHSYTAPSTVSKSNAIKPIDPIKHESIIPVNPLSGRRETDEQLNKRLNDMKSQIARDFPEHDFD